MKACSMGFESGRCLKAGGGMSGWEVEIPLEDVPRRCTHFGKSHDESGY
jgi:hypothetical protein